MGFLNRTCAEIRNRKLYKKWKKNHFLILKRFKNTESAQLCMTHVKNIHRFDHREKQQQQSAAAERPVLHVDEPGEVPGSHREKAQ